MNSGILYPRVRLPAQIARNVFCGLRSICPQAYNTAKINVIRPLHQLIQLVYHISRRIFGDDSMF